MKKLISFFIFSILCIALFSSAVVASESPSSWATDQITHAISLELVPHTLLSEYSQPTTRAEFCTLAVILYENIIGEEIVVRKTFIDTTDVNVQKMGGLGVVSGMDEDMFTPKETLTREQAAVMLANLAKAIGKPLDTRTATFADSTQISSWALVQVGQVQAAGIMSGLDNNNFAPQDLYTREQSITTMLRLHDFLTVSVKDVEDTQDSNVIDLEAFADEVFRLTNIERRNHGLPEFSQNDALTAVAVLRAQELIAYFSHTRPDGSSCFTAYSEYGVTYRTAAENIYQGPNTPDKAVEGWMNSPGHRANILNPALNCLGVGVAIDSKGSLSWSQNFTN